MARAKRERIEVVVDLPHDLEATVGFLHDEDDPFLRRRPDGRVAQAVRTDAGPALVTVEPAERSAPRSRKGVLRIEARGPAVGLAQALDAGRRLAGVAHDESEPAHRRFRRLARGEAALRRAVERWPGLRLGQRPDPVAVVSAAILAQQVTWSFARRMTRALWERHGESVRLDGETWDLPPRAEQLASTRPEELRPLQISERKAEYVRDLCAAIEEGRLTVHALGDRTAESARDELVAHRGVGPTTAAWILLFGAGHPDAWPPADVGLLAALDDGSGRPSVDEAEAWASRLSGVRGIAALHLWASRR